MRYAATAARRRTITITMVEPYPLVRATLRDILGREPDLRIDAEVSTVEDAIELGRRDPSDVVLVDTDAGVARLVPVLQQLKRECPTSAVIVLGHRRGDEELFRSIEAGAAAHLVDSVRPGELVAIIRAVAAGEYIIDASVAARPQVARRVLEAFRSAAQSEKTSSEAKTSAAFEQLSARETQILTLISQGMPNREIAAVLSLSPHTVSNYVKAVLRKLAVNNRTQAVLIALRESWIPTPDVPTRRHN